MREYIVKWDIEVIASSPEQAAREALDSIINGSAKIFSVRDSTMKKKKVLIDLHK